jgi:hypothetical protein
MRMSRRKFPVIESIFPLGQVVITANAYNFCKEHKISFTKRLRRHAKGDWGDLDNDDRLMNVVALQQGRRIFSSYEMPGGEKLWLITESDRSVTTILMATDY